MNLFTESQQALEERSSQLKVVSSDLVFTQEALTVTHKEAEQVRWEEGECLVHVT